MARHMDEYGQVTGGAGWWFWNNIVTITIYWIRIYVPVVAQQPRGLGGVV